MARRGRKPPLPPTGRVHAWIIDVRRLAPERPRFVEALDEEERQRAARFRFERDRLRFVTCRGALRFVLAGYLDVEPRELVFGTGSHGKPFLEAAGRGPLPRFNLARSAEFGLVAVTSDRDVGCDLELVRHDFDLAGMMRSVFTDEEQARVQSLPEERRFEAFFRGWTRKEAFVKAIGDGFSFPLKSVDVFPGDERTSLPIKLAGLPGSDWRVHSTRIAPGYLAAVAIEGPDTVDWREWTR